MKMDINMCHETDAQCLGFFALFDSKRTASNGFYEYDPGTIIFLEHNEKLSSVIDKIDIDVKKLGITFYSKNMNPAIQPIDLSDVEFSKFKKLRELVIRWSSIGINNKTFDNCNQIEYLYLGTLMDYPFDKNNCSSLYTMTNLKSLYINGYGTTKLNDGFNEFIDYYKNLKKNDFEYKFYV